MDGKNYQKYQAIGGIMQSLRDEQPRAAIDKLEAYLQDFDPNWSNARKLLAIVSVEPLNFEQISDRLKLSRQTCIQMVRALTEGGLALDVQVDGRTRLIGIKQVGRKKKLA